MSYSINNVLFTVNTDKAEQILAGITRESLTQSSTSSRSQSLSYPSTHSSQDSVTPLRTDQSLIRNTFLSVLPPLISPKLLTKETNEVKNKNDKCKKKRSDKEEMDAFDDEETESGCDQGEDIKEETEEERDDGEQECSDDDKEITFKFGLHTDAMNDNVHLQKESVRKLLNEIEARQKPLTYVINLSDVNMNAAKFNALDNKTKQLLMETYIISPVSALGQYLNLKKGWKDRRKWDTLDCVINDINKGSAPKPTTKNSKVRFEEVDMTKSSK